MAQIAATPGITSALVSGTYVGGTSSGILVPSTISFDAGGAPIDLLPGQTRGTLQAIEGASGAEWVLGRYAGGQIGFTNGSTPSGGEPLGKGIHFVFIKPATVPLPTNGRAEYALLSFTKPTLPSGNLVDSATFTGDLSIGFDTASPTFGMNATLSFDHGGATDTYTIGSASSLATPFGATRSSGGTLYLDGELPASSDVCGTFCKFLPNFALGGTQGDLVGGAWKINGNDANNNSLTRVIGSALFTRTVAAGSPTPPATIPGTGTPVVLASNTQAFETFSFTTDAAGLASFSVQNQYTFGRGTTTDHEFGSVADIIGWTRWAGGTTAQSFTSGATGSTVYTENGGLPVVWGTRATNVPTTGTADYSMLGSTAVTLTDDTTPGTVDSAALRVAFGATPMVGLGIGVRVGGNDYLLGNYGGIATPDMPVDTATMSFGGDLALTGNGCTPSTCAGAGQGFLAGDGASHAGLRFTFPSAPGRGMPTGAGVVTFTKAP